MENFIKNNKFRVKFYDEKVSKILLNKKLGMLRFVEFIKKFVLEVTKIFIHIHKQRQKTNRTISHSTEYKKGPNSHVSKRIKVFLVGREVTNIVVRILRYPFQTFVLTNRASFTDYLMNKAPPLNLFGSFQGKFPFLSRLSSVINRLCILRPH